ncbi:hypothetical protein MHYP_G00256080 [Metynnis hypsauchen]
MANAAAGLLLQEKSESHSWADNISTLSEQSAPVIVPGERSELQEEHSSHHTHIHTHTHCSSQWSTAARGNHEARAREGGSGEHVNAHARTHARTRAPPEHPAVLVVLVLVWRRRRRLKASHPAAGMSQADAGQRVFQEALRKGDTEGLRSLLQGMSSCEFNVNSFGPEGQTALHQSVIDGNLELVKLLVKFGADVRLANRDGWSALHIAAFGGHQDIALYLITRAKYSSSAL